MPIMVDYKYFIKLIKYKSIDYLYLMSLLSNMFVLNRDLYTLYGIKKSRVNNEPLDNETPVWITSLSETVYATAIISPLWLTVTPGINFETIFGCGLLWIIAYSSLFIQYSSIYYVYDMTSNNILSCEETSSYLQIICLLCFSSLIWVDLFDTIKLTSYLYMLPRTNTIDGKLVESIKFDHTGTAIGFIPENTSGINKLYIIVSIIFILIPKAILAVLLWYFGCKFILGSDSNETILLNSVSLNFLLEIDDYIYKAIISDYVKNTLINDWPSLSLSRAELGLSGDHCTASCKNRYGFYSAWSQPILPILILGIVHFIRYYLC